MPDVLGGGLCSRCGGRSVKAKGFAVEALEFEQACV